MSRICRVALFFFPAAMPSAPAQNVPVTEPLSPQFQVCVAGQPVPVYLARVCNLTAEERKPIRIPQGANTTEASFASFDLNGGAAVTVTCPGAIQSIKVLPTTSEITPRISGNTASFTVAKTGALTVEVNGNWIESLHLFVDPPQTHVPLATDPKVIYFGPGVHEIEQLEAHSGQTVYLAPGAVVYGKPGGEKPQSAILGLVGDHITLCGRGILDGSLCPRGMRTMLSVHGTNITVEGVTLRDSGGWTLPVRQSAQVHIDNVKIFGWRGNSDGIDLCNSRQVEVSDCFLRTFDDLVVLKTDKGEGEERDIDVHHCVLWNEFAHALSLGAELREPLSNIRFHDCDIIHDQGREWLLRVYNCDSAPVQNVVFEDLRIEEARRLMSLWIGRAIWSKEAERGHISGVTFRDITSVAPEVPNTIAVLAGFDAAHAIDHVLFEHILVAGRPMALSDVTQNAFVGDVSVSP